MNELYFDLIKKYPRNAFRIVMGFLLLGAVAFFLLQQETIFSATHLTVFSLAGLYYLFMGFGINPVTVWAKAYIKINRNAIELKPSMFAKARHLDWTALKEVQIKVTELRFILINGDSHDLDYQKLDDEDIQDLKHAVISLCKEKKIALA